MNSAASSVSRNTMRAVANMACGAPDYCTTTAPRAVAGLKSPKNS